MMKKLYMIVVTIVASLLFFSCSEDEYEGSATANQAPELAIYNTSEIISNKNTEVKWYANDVDGYKMTFHYLITSDTSFAGGSNDLAKINSAIDSVGNVIGKNMRWHDTKESYAKVSMPFERYNSDQLFEKFVIHDSLTTPDSLGNPIPDSLRIVYSKFFVYGTDESGKATNVESKIFGRTNNRPDFPVIKSDKLGVLGNAKPDWELSAEKAIMVMAEATAQWKDIDFQWVGKDQDGPDVTLEFSWALYRNSYFDENGDEVVEEVLLDSSSFAPYQSIEIPGVADNNLRDYKVDPLIEGSGDGWDENIRNCDFSSVIFDQQKVGWYTFKLHLRDDAGQEAADYAYVKFMAFTPSFTKDILIIDDTDDNLHTEGRGNPNAVDVEAFYDSMMEGIADYDYEKINFEKPSTSTEPYYPTLEKLAEYRLVIITSDDRSTSSGIDFNKYKKSIASYLDIGGKVWVIGSSSFLLGRSFDDSYSLPNRHVLMDLSGSVPQPSDSLLAEYFGLSTITYGESYEKIRYEEKDARVNFGNYDFVGTGTYDHCEDDLKPMIVDTAKVNDAWWKTKYTGGGSKFKESWFIKENGSLLPNITTIEPLEAEICLSYTSVFDLPKVEGNDTLVYNPLRNDFEHSLYRPYKRWTEDYTGGTEDVWIDTLENGSAVNPFVYRKEGAVGARYIGTNDAFRTAYFSIPLFFMDDSEGSVKHNFSEMINWFRLELNPITGEED